jgi:hypothetical protein
LLILVSCGAVQATSGPPVSGFTPSTFNPARREAAQITEQSLGIPPVPR